MYVAAVAAHAVFGALALVAGVVAFERPPRALGTYLVALVLMLGSLGGAVALEWQALDPSTRVLFLALTALGVAVVARGVQARRRRPAAGRRPSSGYRHALGTTLIALTDAFLVVAVLDLGAPAWAVVATGVVVAVAGHVGIRRRISVLDQAHGSRTTADATTR